MIILFYLITSNALHLTALSVFLCTRIHKPGASPYIFTALLKIHQCLASCGALPAALTDPLFDLVMKLQSVKSSPRLPLLHLSTALNNNHYGHRKAPYVDFSLILLHYLFLLPLVSSLSPQTTPSSFLFGSVRAVFTSLC